MKVKEETIRRICRTVLSRWKEKGLIRPKADDDVLLGKMVGEVMADFRREALGRAGALAGQFPPHVPENQGAPRPGAEDRTVRRDVCA